MGPCLLSETVRESLSQCFVIMVTYKTQRMNANHTHTRALTRFLRDLAWVRGGLALVRGGLAREGAPA